MKIKTKVKTQKKISKSVYAKLFAGIVFCLLGSILFDNSSYAASNPTIRGDENVIYSVTAGYTWVVQRSGLYAFSLKGTDGEDVSHSVSSIVDSGPSTVYAYGGTGAYGVGYIKVKKGDTLTFSKNGGTSLLYHNGRLIAQATGGTDGYAYSYKVDSRESTGCNGTWTADCTECRGTDGTNHCYGFAPNCDDNVCCVDCVVIRHDCCTGSTYNYTQNYYVGRTVNGTDGSISFANCGWHNNKYTNINGGARSYTTTIEAPKVSGGIINMPLSETNAYIVNIHGSYPIKYELNGGYFPDGKGLQEGDIDDWSKMVNPVRPGFTFTGWDVEGLDTVTHKIKKADGTVYTFNSTSIDYKKFTSDYIWIFNLNETGDTIKMTAHWVDNTDPKFISDTGVYDAVTFRNTEDGLNSDSSLQVLLNSNASSYTVNRMDGTLNSLRNVAVSESYLNAHADKITALASSTSGPVKDKYPVGFYQYPNRFGSVIDKQLYYTGTWTNKSVTVTASAYDGYKDEYQKNPSYVGGSGIDKIRFNKESWVKNSNSSPNQQGMSVSKTYEGRAGKVTIYNEDQTVEVVDRANQANTTVGQAWDANSSVNSSKITFIDTGNESTWIKIDMQKPVIFDPTAYKNTSQYGSKMAMMYEGYKVPDDLADDEYGWTNTNVRIVIYATDGDGSGISGQAFCWVPDGSGIDYRNNSNWQSADQSREYSYEYTDAFGKTVSVTETIPVSTKVVDQNESGYVYVRDAVGNYSCIRYEVDHIDKKAPFTYPDQKPKQDDVDNEPLPKDPDHPEDYVYKEDTDYTFQNLDNELTYDWVNYNLILKFHAKEEEEESPKYGASGISRMELFQTDSSFSYQASDSKAKVRYKEEIEYECKTQGITYFVLEIEDRASNLTSVNLTVKIDKTAPVIPDILFEEAGLSTSRFYIEDIDLNKYGVDEVESKIQDFAAMRRSFLFVGSDYNNTAYGSSITDESDSSGICQFIIRLINADDSTDYKEYKLTDGDNYTFGSYGSETRVGFLTGPVTGFEYEPAINTMEFAHLSSIKVPLAATFGIEVNTFKDFPHAAALKYEIIIKDRAGNQTKYNSLPGNEIKNFSVKAVMRYAGILDEDSVSISASANTNFNIEQVDPVNNKLTNVPYYKAGEFGYIDVWTIGYVPEIGLDFKDVGDESKKEITIGYMKPIYSLGIKTSTDNVTSYTRTIPYTCASKISTSLGDQPGSGIPFASHYGFYEKKCVDNSSFTDFANHFENSGTALRIPVYYPLVPDGTTKSDGSANYEWELHYADIYAFQKNKKYQDISSAPYVIWDSKLPDAHYRITHES